MTPTSWSPTSAMLARFPARLAGAGVEGRVGSHRAEIHDLLEVGAEGDRERSGPE